MARKKSILLLLLSAIPFSIIFSFTGLWYVNKEKAVISFYFPGNNTRGTIGGLQATIHFDSELFSEAHISASVEVKSLKTDSDEKTEHLKSSDFFNEEKFPLITFTSDSFSKTDSGFTVSGTLALKDSIKRTDVPFTFEQNGDSGLFKGSMVIGGADFGLVSQKHKDNDQIIINLEIPVFKN